MGTGCVVAVFPQAKGADRVRVGFECVCERWHLHGVSSHVACLLEADCCNSAMQSAGVTYVRGRRRLRCLLSLGGLKPSHDVQGSGEHHVCRISPYHR